MTKSLFPIVVLIGGNGSNLQALIDNAADYQIKGVISHNPNVFGLVRAQNAGISAEVIDHRAYPSREAFEEALLVTLKTYAPKLLVLAGFMRILSPYFLDRCPIPILNIHPSLLPKYKGLDTHQRVIDNKEKEHGVSVHFVTKELDGGPIVAQVKVPVYINDTVELLSKRVFAAEHWLYPQIVRWFAQNRLKYSPHRVTLDGSPLGPQGETLQQSFEQGTVS